MEKRIAPIVARISLKQSSNKSGKQMMRYKIPLMALALSACTTLNPPHDTSTLNKINDELKQAAAPKEKTAVPLPESVSRSLLPPLKMTMPRATGRQLEQRFDLVVNDVPANEVFMGIVSGTRYSILVQPKRVVPRLQTTPAAGAEPAATLGLPEKMSVNLKDVTIFEALDAIRNLYGYEYRVDGTRIYVQPPELQVRVFQISYIPGIRRGVSDLRVIGGASATTGTSSNSGNSSSASGSSGTSRSGAGAAQVQASALRTGSKADVWGEIEDTIRTVLSCRIPQESQDSSSSSSTGSFVSFPGDSQTGTRDRGVDGCADGRAMTVNEMSGTILVRGMPDELRTIEKMLHMMQVNIERQVMIEAKIIDVQLNKNSQQGINWSIFQHGVHRFSVGADSTSITETTNGGLPAVITSETITSDSTGTSTDITFTPSTLGGLLGSGLIGNAAGTAFSAGLGVALQLRNFSALLNFLQTQGEVHVLSSPRISTLNNQKAVLKVGKDEQFVVGVDTNNNNTSVTGSNNNIASSLTPVFATYFSGISLDVTPHIDDNGNITLHVHPLVSEISEVEKRVQGTQTLPFASNSINETDSVVKVKDGQVVVIGGLMTESYSDGRSKVPGIGDAAAVGSLFRKGNQTKVKRELVILLKPTVVQDNSAAWADDISATQGRIESMSPSMQAQPGDQQ